MRLHLLAAALLIPAFARRVDTAPATPAAQPERTGPRTSAAQPSTGEDITAFLIAVRNFEVDVIRTDENRTVRWARYLCSDIRKGMTGAKLDRQAAWRFTGGNVTLTEAQGAKMAELVKRYMCP